MNCNKPTPVAGARIALLGLGTIGKRLADAVLNVPEFSLVGVGVRRAIPAMAPLIAAGIPIYCSEGKPASMLERVCAGDLGDLLDRCDIILDCTPRGTGAGLRSSYKKAGVRAVFQGGETAGVAQATYCSGLGFEDARSARSVRVLSCNTTGLLRLARCLAGLSPLTSIRAVLTRSATDPDKFAKGIPNSLVASLGESHHGRDIRELWPDLDILTLASYAPVNCGHLISMFARPRHRVSAEDVSLAITQAPRTRIVDGDGSLADLRRTGSGNLRNDCHDVIVWRDGIAVTNDEISLSAAIHMEAIVIPETIDVLFAMTGLAGSAEQAMSRSDAAVSRQVEPSGEMP